MCYNVALTYVQVKVACSIILMTGVRCATIIQSLDSIGKVLVKKKISFIFLTMIQSSLSAEVLLPLLSSDGL